MGKTQKSISVPMEEWLKFEKLFEDNKQKLYLLSISSPSELLRTLAKMGEKPFLEWLAELDILRKMKAETPKKP